MSLDTKYRPLRYAEVLGQQATIEVCKQIVREGKGFHQSYVFAGAHGGGKTTTARIMGRAMLCENPQDGEPCDECYSCKSILEDRSENFVEVDAATNSGKEHVKRITEEAQFGSFSGKRKIYLFDECFTEDTMLLTPAGSRSIKDLVEQRYEGLVLSHNVETGERCWKPVTNWYDIEDERECLTLEFDNGAVLTVTSNQELFTKNRGWVVASDLTEEDDICDTEIASLASRWERQMARLVRSTPVGKQKVYDVTVAETHSFFAYSREGGSKHAVLAHNCHELSKSAMDAMLKPLEDNIRGTEERQLVCLFCTTEPRKMRSAIMSRCAPAFKIQINTPEEIAGRLKYICDAEGLEYDEEVLPLIAEVVECHVRDSIKAIEGVSMLGKIDRENVERYLHLDANVLYLDLLESIGTDLPRALATIGKLNERVSPAVTYERMAEVAMMAYRLSHVGTAAVPSYWDKDRLKDAGDLHREFLVEFAQRFAERPSHPTSSMLTCDVASLHQRRAGIVVVAEARQEAVAPATMSSTPIPAPAPISPVDTLEPQVSVREPAAQSEVPSTPIEELPKKTSENAEEAAKASPDPGTIRVDAFVNPVGVHIEPKAQQVSGASSTNLTSSVTSITTDDFVKVLRFRVFELSQEKSISGRPARRDDMGSS